MNYDNARPSGGMVFDDNDYVRPPDAANFDTLMQTTNVPVQGRRQRRGRAQARGRHSIQHTPVRAYTPTPTPPPENELAIAIQASMHEYNEQALMDQIMQESAELYERDCMLRADADSLDNCNIDRQLQITKAQCQKMARFDADYAVLAKWIQGGCITPIDPHIKNKLKQVRLPASEMDIIMMTTPDTQNREGWSLTPM